MVPCGTLVSCGAVVAVVSGIAVTRVLSGGVDEITGTVADTEVSLIVPSPGVVCSPPVWQAVSRASSNGNTKRMDMAFVFICLLPSYSFVFR